MGPLRGLLPHNMSPSWFTALSCVRLPVAATSFVVATAHGPLSALEHSFATEHACFAAVVQPRLVQSTVALKAFSLCVYVGGWAAASGAGALAVCVCRLWLHIGPQDGKQQAQAPTHWQHLHFSDCNQNQGMRNSIRKRSGCGVHIAHTMDKVVSWAVYLGTVTPCQSSVGFAMLTLTTTSSSLHEEPASSTSPRGSSPKGCPKRGRRVLVSPWPPVAPG